MLSHLRVVPIAKCVHYCGFHYGRGEFNPYENYIVGLSRKEPLTKLRENFVDFIQYYRPRTLGDALGVTTQTPVELWLLPWKSWAKLFRGRGWTSSVNDVVDIITYFSPRGVCWSRILEEFNWLEGAWSRISQHGYQPAQNSYIEVFELRGERESRFLVLDGNHRLSALSAIGAEEVLVRQNYLAHANRRFARYWPLVLSRHVSLDDALVLFDAYFRGNLRPHRADANEKAAIIY